MCSLGSNWQYGSIGSDNGLAPNRRQAIIWTNVGMLYGHISVARPQWDNTSALKELTMELYESLLPNKQNIAGAPFTNMV